VLKSVQKKRENMSIAERMKKYAVEKSYDNAPAMLEDLQATMQALEVARELIFPICQLESGAEVNSSFDEPYSAKRAREALKTIDNILGAKP
jgi:hypothetical protein